MADQRISQLTRLSKAGAAAGDLVPVADVSASESKAITLKDLVAAGIDLVDAGEIDLAKLDQASVTKLGTGALADGAATAVKLAADSVTAVAGTAPSTGNHRGRGWFNSSTGNLQVWDGAAFAQVVLPTAGIGDLQVTTGKLADGAVTTAKVTPLGSAAYAAGSVNTAALADLGVTTGKIAVGAITAALLAAGAVDTAALAPAAVTYSKLQNLSGTDLLLGRASEGAGTVEEIPLTAAGRALIAGLSAEEQRNTLGLGTLATASGTWVNGSSFSGTSTGDNTGDQTITLTGDVTGTGTGTFAATIADAAITELKYAALSIPTGALQDDAITAAKMADQSAAVVSNATPSGDGAFVGQQWINTSTAVEYSWTGVEWLRQASLSTLSFIDSTPLGFAVAYPDPYSAEITTTLDTQQAATVFAGPDSGQDAAPTFRALLPSDLPVATAEAVGVSRPGAGLTIADGVMAHSNAVTGATVSGFTFDGQGHITAAVPLVAADIPALDASKIATGQFATARLADAAVTGPKLANYTVGKLGETLPAADFISQLHFNPLDKTFFMWDGNVWQPIGISAGAVIFAGTYNADDNEVDSVTSQGQALGLTVGDPLPSAAAANAGYYVVVSESGTGTAPAPAVALAPPDIILSTGNGWVEIDVSSGYTAQAAVNVAFTPAGAIAASNVQAAVEEVSTECRNADNITGGTLAVARGGTGSGSYTKGDLLAASGATTLAKLGVGTNGQILQADSSTATGLKWASVGTGTVTSVTSATAALTVATGTTTPALTIRSASTSVNGIVQLSDSTSTTSSSVAATATAVKAAYDLAAAALPKAGGTVTGELLIGTAGSLVFEGSVDDGFETTVAVANPTADRTVTIPNETGTIVTTGSSGVVTNAMLANNAAIALSKLATGALPTAITVASANIVDGTIVDADINASAGITLTKLATGALPTAITVASANIVDGTIVDADINAAAAIAGSKIAPDFAANVRIGQTSSDTPGSGNNTYGISLRTSGNGYFSAQDAIAGLFNRSNDGSIISIRRAGTQVGSISVTSSATTYGTSSDYRLKENLRPLTGAIERLFQLPVYRGNFIAAPGQDVDMFLAHEAADVVPNAVQGVKDGVEYQVMDHSKMVPLLWAALQETIARLAIVEASIA